MSTEFRFRWVGRIVCGGVYIIFFRINFFLRNIDLNRNIKYVVWGL